MNAIALFLMTLLPTDDSPKPKFPLGKETTYVSGPLDKDGYIDYEAALNERLGKGVTPETNANVLIWKAIGPRPEGLRPEYFKLLGIDEPAENGEYFVGLSAFAKEHLKLDADETQLLFDQFRPANVRPWKRVQLPHIATWLKLNEKPLAIVVEAAKRPAYFNPVVTPRINGRSTGLPNALLPKVQKCREAVSALTTRAMLRIDEGQIDQAWQDLLTGHRLARIISRGGSVVEGLTGIALDAVVTEADLAFLERAPQSIEQIRQRQSDLQKLPPISAIADKVELCERFWQLETIQNTRRYGQEYLDGIGNNRTPTKSAPYAMKALENTDWAPALRNANTMIDRIVSAMRLAERTKRQRELEAIDLDLKKLKTEIAAAMSPFGFFGATNENRGKKIGDLIICFLSPAFRKLQDACDRSEQTQRNLHLAFALAAHRRDTGHYPATLNDLTPKYLAAVPGDLFTDQPLTYRASENGYLLYSFGPNGKDDDGRRHDDDQPGDDLAVRMPLPPVRSRK